MRWLRRRAYRQTDRQLIEGVVYELRMIREALERMAYRKQNGS